MLRMQKVKLPCDQCSRTPHRMVCVTCRGKGYIEVPRRLTCPCGSDAIDEDGICHGCGGRVEL